MNTVVSAREYGARGYQALLAKYGKQQLDRWRRLGGRPRDLSFDEIQMAATRRRRRVSKQGGSQSTEFDANT